MRYGQQQLVFLNGLFLALLLGIYGEDLLHVPLGALAVGMAGFFFLSLFLLVRESSRTWLASLLLFLFFGAWASLGARLCPLMMFRIGSGVRL